MPEIARGYRLCAQGREEREDAAMASTYSVRLSELVSEFDFSFFYKATDYEKIHVTVDDVSRPGLHLAGFLTISSPCAFTSAARSRWHT